MSSSRVGHGMASLIEKARRMELRRKIGNRMITEPPRRAPVGSYLIAHACFSCRKCFKIQRRDNGVRAAGLIEQKAMCPHCRRELALMGRSFRAPRRMDAKQWKKVEKLWSAGFRFWSSRSFPHSEPLPEKLAEVDASIARNPRHPMRTG